MDVHIRFSIQRMKPQSIFYYIILLIFLASCKEPDTPGPDPQEPKEPSIIKLLDFFPKEGQVDDVITIIGENFNLNSSKLRVYFDGKEASRTAVSDDTLRCIVPQGMDGKPVPIQLEFEGDVIFSEAEFTHLSPVIEKISQLEGSYDELIILEGEHFHPRAFRNKVFFNEIPANVLSASKTKIECKVPLDLRDSISQISLKIENTEDTFDDSFRILAPKINDLSKLDIKIGETLVIEGAYFHPDIERNIVRLGDSIQEILSSTIDRIEIKIRDQAFASRKQDLRLEVFDHSTTFPDSLVIKNNWIRRAKLPRPDPNIRTEAAIAFTLNQKGYVGLSINRISKLFYRFDEEGGYFERKADYPGGALLHAAVFTLGSYAYVGMGDLQSGYPAREGYVYEPQYNQWRTMAVCPSALTDMKGFSIGNKGYYLAGGFGHLNFWEYDLHNFSWSPKSSLPISSDYRDMHAVFGTEIQGKGYIVTERGDQNHIWEYDPTQDTWSIISPVPFINARTTAFVINGLIYVVGADYDHDNISHFYSYDLLTNSWTDLSQLNPPPLFSKASFSLGGKAFFTAPWIGGRSNLRNEFIWEFDPNP